MRQFPNNSDRLRYCEIKGANTFFDQRVIQLAFAIFAIGMIVLAGIGGIHAYTPVPFWDMLSGSLKFFIQASDGDRSAWWAQHNEHRILLARGLFWLDYRYFGGVAIFLTIANYLFPLASIAIFWHILRDMAGTSKADAAQWVFAFVMSAWLFQWMQSENFTWAFQSQFFLAQIAPLLSLYLLARAARNPSANGTFLGACIFGIASACSMANGVIALPLLITYAILTKQGRMRICMLGLLSAVVLYLYFHEYVAPPHHGSLKQALKDNPIGLIHYVLLYVGNPFHYLFGQGGFGHIAAVIAGLALVTTSVLAAIRILPAPRKSPMALALLAFILYIGGTALGTAGGRLIFGSEQALSSRYTTPALMAWVALALIHARWLLNAMRTYSLQSLIVLGGLATVMSYQQRYALAPMHERVYQSEIAGLAMELGVMDSAQLMRIFPQPSVALDIANNAIIRQLSVFGIEPLRGMRAAIGTKITPSASAPPSCKGSLDAVEALEGELRFKRVSGWLIDSTVNHAPKVIQFVNNSGMLVGFALSGNQRDDVAKNVGTKDRHTGFHGYALASELDKHITMRDSHGACELQARVHNIPFTVRTPVSPSESVSASKDSITVENQWIGSDFYRSGIPGLAVYGSFVNADSDIGSITLKIRRGDRLLYRSGPTSGHQILEIPHSEYSPVVLPNAVEWKLLEFSDKNLPANEFLIKLSDEGTGWGEWSAIAVRNE